jgi:methanogenic corrinoid protein MtbC1
MDNLNPTDTQAQGISATEQETGLSKDTLRVWEKRYGFPQPRRNIHGERLYPAEQIITLQLLKRLTDVGLRPAKIIGLGNAELRSLLGEHAQRGAPAPVPSARLAGIVETDGRISVDSLRQKLEWALLESGLARFVTEVVAPLNILIGDAWSRGEIEIYEEHLHTELVQNMLRTAMHTIPPGTGRPRVLLSTLPGEVHGLGLLMVETLLSLEGCRCISLGVQTPRADIVTAAREQDVDIIALSVSALARTQVVEESISWLLDSLPANIDLWVGGSGAVQKPRLPAGLALFGALEQITPAVTDWRARQPATPQP